VTGVLAVLKPPGPTSHDVVERIRRWTGVRRVGHAGTLDPPAAGVLPVLLGGATRVADYLHLPPKVYRFLLVLGEVTETLDQAGPVRRRTSAAHLSRADLEAVLPRFVGPLVQEVPAYAARRVEGRRLYAWARQERDPGPRPLAACTVHRLDVLAWRGGERAEALCEVVASRGTYVRALARDIGEALGVGGHVGALIRVAAGGFTLADAVPLEELAASVEDGDLPGLRSPAEALGFLPAVVVGGREAAGVRHGRPPAPRPRPPAPDPEGLAPEARGLVRVLDPEGTLLAVARWHGPPAGPGRLTLERVLAAAGTAQASDGGGGKGS
jgi:tRNA pseudouridine55 synthase